MIFNATSYKGHISVEWQVFMVYCLEPGPVYAYNHVILPIVQAIHFDSTLENFFGQILS